MMFYYLHELHSLPSMDLSNLPPIFQRPKMGKFQFSEIRIALIFCTLGSLYLKCIIPKASSIVITLEVVKDAECQVPPQPYWICICVLTISSGDLYALIKFWEGLI